MHRISLLLGILWAVSPPGHATVYKVVDEHGNITYTDAPPAGASQAQEVKLPAINRQPATEVRPASSRPPAEEPAERSASYQHAAIRSPAHDSTVPAGDSRLTVEVELEPALQEGHWVQILIDGAAAGSPAQNTLQSVQDLERGMHFLSAVVLDSNGHVVAETDAVTIHIRRPVVGGPTSGQPRPPGAAVPRGAPK